MRTGNYSVPDRKEAIDLAMRETPLRQVDKVTHNLIMPPRLVITGTDEQGRQMVVWVRHIVDGYTYLSGLLTEQRALQAGQTAGLDAKDLVASGLEVVDTFGRRNQVIWVLRTAHKELWVDAQSGAVLSFKDLPSLN